MNNRQSDSRHDKTTPAVATSGADVLSAPGSEGEGRRFRYWQIRTLIATMTGYAAFYLVRKNLSIAMPSMEADLGISKADLGLFLTIHGLLYGVSKFFNGILGDLCNARIFMVTGLALSALTNVFFGFGSSVLVLGVIWMINGWFQGMGFPPCGRLLTHWYRPDELATKMSIWNTSHSIGAGLAVIGCGYIAAHFGWRWCFFMPAATALALAGGLWMALRDTPSSVGLPEIQSGGAKDKAEQSTESESFRRFVRRRVFGNPYIWIVSIGSFFVYTLRYSVLDWGPTLLTQTKGVSISYAGWMVAAFEIAGVVGMLAAGWLTDRLFGGRGARMCVVCMLLATLSVFLFWRWQSAPAWLSTVILGTAGFFIYGPQGLAGIVAANLATKRAAATAIGFLSLFSYLSTILSGWGLGKLVQTYGWNCALAALIGAGGVGTLMFCLAWPAKAHGYDDR